MTLPRLFLTSAIGTLLLVSACNETSDPKADTADFKRCSHFDPLRQPLFGDTHVHTLYSFDARTQGTDTDHADAYAFARGAEIEIPPYDSDGNALRSLQLDRPLDFVAISDHSEFLGTVAICQDPNAAGYNDSVCQKFREDDVSGFTNLGVFLGVSPDAADYPELCGDGAADCLRVGADIWKTIQEEAEAAYDRTDACSFTSFIAYEWTGTPATRNLHRNVIFRNDVVPDNVISYFDAPEIELLWEALREQCIDADGPCDALTIPHNSNLGDGVFFKDETRRGDPFDADYTLERQLMEPVFEIYQHKGASECIHGAPIADEFCQFELVDYDTFGSNFLGTSAEQNAQNFLRFAFGEGMQHQQQTGYNPFKHGLIASTDTHISVPGGADERSFPGHGGAGQVNKQNEGERVIPGLVDTPYNSAGGLAVVWAEENSREAIFQAMRRRETYGTSGPRISVRFFGGWGYESSICSQPDMVAQGYAGGVPMGGDLLAGPEGAAPVFVVAANQDPGTAQRPGTPLQRVQIVKGWLDASGQSQVQVYDVAGTPDNGATVDLATCEVSGTGDAALCQRWVDPDFDPAQPAYYYARVIENPTCRWSTWSCLEADYDCTNPDSEIDDACCDPVLGLNVEICTGVDCDDLSGATEQQERCCAQPIEPAVQERAWTSPIWYEP